MIATGVSAQMREVEGKVYDISPLVKFESHWLSDSGEPLWPREPHPSFDPLREPDINGWEIFPDRCAPALAWGRPNRNVKRAFCNF